MFALIIARLVAMWHRLWFRDQQPAAIASIETNVSTDEQDTALDGAEGSIARDLGMRATADPTREAKRITARARRRNAQPQDLDLSIGTEEEGDAADLHWHFRRGILDRLDEYFVCVRQVQKHDPRAYRLYSRLGFAITANGFLNPDHPDYGVIAADARYGFGGILFASGKHVRTHRDHQKFTYPTFIYFEKLRRPSRVELFHGDVYRLVLIYDDHHRQLSRIFSFPVECHVGVDPAGRTQILREVVSRRHKIIRRTGNRREVLWLTVQSFEYPPWVYDLPDKNVDPLAWPGDALRLAMLSYGATHKRIIIRVKRDGCTAAFGIDVKRARHFFHDRDATEIAVDGRRKRIFHSVVQHTRVLHDDRTTTVRAHYRGIRKFEWNGYAVAIVMPRNNAILEMPIAGTYQEDWEGDRRQRVGPAALGRRLDRLLSD